MLGFTLIELMIVVIVVAILLTVAVVSYQSSTIKTNRSQAKTDLVVLTQQLERYYLVNNTYVGFSIPTTQQQSPSAGAANYTIGFASGPSVTLYTLRATPASSQQKKDSCGNLNIDQAGTKTAATTDCW